MRRMIAMALFSVLSGAQAALPHWKATGSNNLWTTFTVDVPHDRNVRVVVSLGCGTDTIIGPTFLIRNVRTNSVHAGVETSMEFHTDARHASAVMRTDVSEQRLLVYPPPQSTATNLALLRALSDGRTFDFALRLLGFTSSEILFSVPTADLKALLSAEPRCVPLLKAAGVALTVQTPPRIQGVPTPTSALVGTSASVYEHQFCTRYRCRFLHSAVSTLRKHPGKKYEYELFDGQGLTIYRNSRNVVTRAGFSFGFPDRDEQWNVVREFYRVFGAANVTVDQYRRCSQEAGNHWLVMNRVVSTRLNVGCAGLGGAFVEVR